MRSLLLSARKLHSRREQEGQLRLVLLPLATHENRILFTSPIVRAFAPSGFRRLSSLLCPLLTSARWSGRLAAPSVPSYPGTPGRSPEVSSRNVPRFAVGSTPSGFDGYGLCCAAPARPPLMPYLRFFHISARVCYALSSDPASRRRPCASLTLHLHQVG